MQSPFFDQCINLVNKALVVVKVTVTASYDMCVKCSFKNMNGHKSQQFADKLQRRP